MARRIVGERCGGCHVDLSMTRCDNNVILTRFRHPERTSDASTIPPTSRRSPWSILAVLCASVFIIVVDGTIVNVALPTFVRELGATTSQLQWIVDAYVLVFAGLLMAAGSIGDRFGRKGTLMVGMAAFGATSVVRRARHDRRRS